MTILDAVSRAAAEPDYETEEDEQHSHQTRRTPGTLRHCGYQD